MIDWGMNIREEDATDAKTGLHTKFYAICALENRLRANLPFVACHLDLNSTGQVDSDLGADESLAYVVAAANIFKDFSENALVAYTGCDEFLILEPEHDMEWVNARLDELHGQLAATETRYARGFTAGVAAVDGEHAFTSGRLLHTIAAGASAAVPANEK